MTFRKEHMIAWLEALQRIYSENREWLTELDSAIGDADHGTNMDRGFTAARAEVAAASPADLRGVLQTLATSLIRHTGGASGALYGTFFLRASAACAGKQELDAADFVAMFQAGVRGIQQRGKAEAGDKTMLDALAPALTAMRRGLENGGSLASLLEEGAAAAKAGMRATIAMQARKGRASYLGPRSAGHQDPGATSAWLLLATAPSVFPGK
jgi:phosphoenolpyruvate---glycerone phosphotransferase subunit DhaL